MSFTSSSSSAIQIGALLAVLALACSQCHAQRRSLWNGDLLGIIYSPPPPPADVNEAELSPDHAERSRVQHLAHQYNAAEVLTRWAESTFALTAKAHAALVQQPGGPTGSACVYDGNQCLFNPMNLGSGAFPVPELPAEKTLKRFALEAMSCRLSTDRATCHLDANCDWDDTTGACFLAHDPHSDFAQAIAPCNDDLYTPQTAACWRRRPVANSPLPCGSFGCKLYPRSPISVAGGVGSQQGGGLPEDRCMPDLPASSSSSSTTSSSTGGGGVAAASMRPAQLYALLKGYYGLGMEGDAAAAAAAAGGEAGGGAGATVPAGFGRCHAAALHEAFLTVCREPRRETCLADARCAWMSGIVRGKHCVLSRDTVIQLLLGSSPFTHAVRQVEKSCLAASASRDSCLAVSLVLRSDQPQQQQQQ
ncbi:hypothetical protein Agub_g8290 [Astrephomene gubernaculifera]|uniref:Uncharacterized protein n=1 Tax=Astrephomene gubernaculifera TaxID=47775 RepID=A0AAD3DRE9_9CHLO|nr:hypothetical protein Agub_g8290 [Astrephomene gubernaculifera]